MNHSLDEFVKRDTWCVHLHTTYTFFNAPSLLASVSHPRSLRPHSRPDPTGSRFVRLVGLVDAGPSTRLARYVTVSDHFCLSYFRH